MTEDTVNAAVDAAHPNATAENPTGASSKLHQDTLALIAAAHQECVDIVALVKSKF